MSKFYFSLLLFCGALFSYAQNTVTIEGKILEKETQLPLEAATVYLSTVADSTVIDYTITKKDGSFMMKTKKIDKPVFIKVSYIGYQTFIQEEKSIRDSKNFGTINLEENANLLGEVIVISEAPPVRIKNDTLEFNASSFKLRPDANVETLLKQLPGVEIDAEGKITVNGKEVNQILVNGKPFFDKDGKIALQNLPSDIINKVQVTDSKTKQEEISGQKAASNEASINLTIDEDKNKGFFGKVMGGFGSDERYESSLLFNYFKNKQKISVLASSNNINSTGFSMNEIFDSMGGGRNSSIFVNDSNGSFGINGMRFGGGAGITQSNMVGINYTDELFKGFDAGGSYFYTDGKTENVNRTRQITLLTDDNFTTESNGKTRDDKFAHNLSFNIEYKIDSTATLFLSPKFVKAKSKYSNQSDEFSISDDGRLLNDNVQDNIDESDNNSFSNSLYFYKSFNKKGRAISAYLNNDNSKDEATNLNRSLSNLYLDEDEDGVTDDVNVILRDQTRFQNIIRDTYSFGTEYFEPLKDSIRLKIGFEYERKLQVNDKVTYDFDSGTGNYSLLNPEQTNYLNSTNNTITPGVGISIEKNKYYLGINAGTAITKLENSSLYLGDKVNLSREYVLPSVNMWGRYKFTKSMSVFMNYDYQINFPTPAQVLPVEDLSNPLSTLIGNPNLDPEKSHRSYISFNNYDYATKSGFTIYANGTYYEKQIASSTTFDSSRKRTTRYENVADSYSTWIGGNWNKSIKKEAHSFKYGVGLNTGLSRNKGFVEGEGFESRSLRLTPRVNFTYDYGELLSVNPTYSYTYNKSDYKNYVIDEASTFQHKFNVQLTSYWPKHVIFGTDLGYTYNSNIAEGFKKDFYLLNMSLGYNLLGDQLLAKVKVYDLLNQNQSTIRTITPTYIRDEENIVLTRYLMFSLTYKLDKFAGKKKSPSSGVMFQR